jgi:hypothetical protein
VGEQTDGAVIGDSETIRDMSGASRRIRLRETDDRPVGGEQLTGVAGDRVEQWAGLRAIRELEGDLVQGRLLALATSQILDEVTEPDRGRDLLRDVGQRVIGQSGRAAGGTTEIAWCSPRRRGNDYRRPAQLLGERGPRARWAAHPAASTSQSASPGVMDDDRRAGKRHADDPDRRVPPRDTR